MPIPRYGVYRFQPKDKRLATINEPHYQILGVDASAQLRAAVNARSNQNPPDVLYFVNENLDVPFETRLLNVPMGFKPLRSIPGGLAIDYIQSNLFDIQQMKPLDTDHSAICWTSTSRARWPAAKSSLLVRNGGRSRANPISTSVSSPETAFTTSI